MRQLSKGEMIEVQKCKEDPFYFLHKYGAIKDHKEKTKLWRNVYPYLPAPRHEFLITGPLTKKQKARRKKRESRFSEIKKVLVKERYLKRFGKMLSKRVVRDVHGAVVVMFPLEMNPRRITFPMYCQKEHTPILDCGPQTSGYAAVSVMRSGEPQIICRPNFMPSFLLQPF